MLARYAIRSPKNLETVLTLRREHVEGRKAKVAKLRAAGADTGADTRRITNKFAVGIPF